MEIAIDCRSCSVAVESQLEFGAHLTPSDDKQRNTNRTPTDLKQVSRRYVSSACFVDFRCSPRVCFSFVRLPLNEAISGNRARLPKLSSVRVS